MRIKQFVLFLLFTLLITSKCALYEKSKNTINEKAEEAADYASEKYHRGRDTISEKLEEVGDTMKEMYHRARDASSEKLEDIKESVGDTFEKVKNVGQRIIGRGADTVGEKLYEGKEAVKDAYYTGKRKFNKYSNMLEDSYYIGWDKIDRLYRGGKLSLLDFKDLLGEKYDDFSDYIGEKVEKGKDMITPRSSRRVRDIYELFWDNIEELVSTGKLNVDQVKDFFGDKWEDVKDKGKDALDLDTRDINKWKNKLGEWSKLFKPEEKKTWWTAFTTKLGDMRDSFKDSVGMSDDRSLNKRNLDNGWDIVNNLLSSKKLNLDDLKDILGDKFDTIKDFVGEDNVDKVSRNVKDNVRWISDVFHDKFTDFFDDETFNFDYFAEVIAGFVPDDGLGGKSKKEIQKDIDNLKEVIIQIKEKIVGESHPRTFWEKFKDKIESVTDSAKEKLGITTKSRPRRIFDKATNKLENLYNFGWDKLYYFFKHGKLNIEDFKDLLGDKYEEVFNFFTEKLDSGKEGVKDVLTHGKRILKNPERLRDIYEMIWDYVDEQYRKGSIGFEQIKDLIGDNFEDVSDTIIEGIDKGKDVVKSVTGTDRYDVELDRLKRKILEMKNTLSEHSEGGFWSNFVNMISNFKNRAFGTGKNRQPAGRSERSTSSRGKEHDTSSTEL